MCNSKSEEDEDEADITQGLFKHLKTRQIACETTCETQTKLKSVQGGT